MSLLADLGNKIGSFLREKVNYQITKQVNWSDEESNDIDVINTKNISVVKKEIILNKDLVVDGNKEMILNIDSSLNRRGGVITIGNSIFSFEDKGTMVWTGVKAEIKDSTLKMDSDYNLTEAVPIILINSKIIFDNCNFYGKENSVFILAENSDIVIINSNLKGSNYTLISNINGAVNLIFYKKINKDSNSIKIIDDNIPIVSIKTNGGGFF